ncbi:hypothetical protein J6590_079482 [Homalodisca vitripennis]|nr:hypothetical protein J6590_079482 [Homalodisca vitripennis]
MDFPPGHFPLSAAPEVQIMHLMSQLLDLEYIVLETRHFNIAGEKDVQNSKLTKAASILGEADDADLNDRGDEYCFESVSVDLYGDSFFFLQTRSKEVVLVLLG